MIHLVFLLEEESSKKFLESLLPRIFPDLDFRCIAFEGKQDLEKNIPIKLKAYNVPNSYFIILRDQDSGDCKEVKSKLKELCEKTNKSNYKIRIACRELESWYFGNLESVGSALKIDNLSSFSKRKRFREPDLIVNPKKELKQITNNLYSQVSCSIEIGRIFDFENNTSYSFQVFFNGIRNIIKQNV